MAKAGCYNDISLPLPPSWHSLILKLHLDQISTIYLFIMYVHILSVEKAKKRKKKFL